MTVWVVEYYTVNGIGIEIEDIFGVYSSYEKAVDVKNTLITQGVLYNNISITEFLLDN